MEHEAALLALFRGIVAELRVIVPELGPEMIVKLRDDGTLITERVTPD